ncbi:MAG: glycosyltransferase family 4 protein [Planctomycetota bacterium]
MKSPSKRRRRMDRNNQPDAADELIREITEHVEARAVPNRRVRRRGDSEEHAAVTTSPLVEMQVVTPPAAAVVAPAPVAAALVPAVATPAPVAAASVPAVAAPASVAAVSAAAPVAPAPVAAASVLTVVAPAPVATALASVSLITHPSSLITHPSSLITHPSSLILHPSSLSVLAIFCYEDSTSSLGQYVAEYSNLLAQRGTTVHIFSRKAFTNVGPAVQVHETGDYQAENLVASVQEFSNRVQISFARHFSSGVSVTLLGQEWTTIPAVLALGAKYNCNTIISMHSMECQRSDMSSELSQKIKSLELQGLAQANTVLFQQTATAEMARKMAPDCARRFVLARQSFPIQDFISALDPGEIKKRIQVGPIDPLILFIGNLDERHGPDLLMKSLPAVLKNHKQARFAFVGDGALQWPLRVHARYLLLEHAVRILGHLSGQPLYELIHACDMIAVPSRDLTSEWPILAGWAASKPVFATHNATKSLIKHDHNGILVYPSENSCVWGIERILNNTELRFQLGRNGHQKLQECYGTPSVVEQLRELMGVRVGA